MTERDKLERARMYIYKLANGIDPISDREMPEDAVLNQVRLSRCFFYVAEALDRYIRNYERLNREKAPKKEAFALTPEQWRSIEISEQPIPISIFAQRVNAALADENRVKFAYRWATDWLLEAGYLRIPPGAKGKLPTDAGQGLGIFTQARQSQNGPYTAVLYSREAQKFLLDNMDAMLARRGQAGESQEAAEA
ncbi:MAG: hypothetical protein BWY35_02000 [Firmicutes bacterium ADurb.Bin248]|nr:MAG: hypothetical protein BWY35_02000 [Firmicutes bacterium ADurb.Bin248]HOG00159.1 hypothetical protein [Clostridia bacterium]HPK15560.1 hypothetical protein [Clostridia bacterium]